MESLNCHLCPPQNGHPEPRHEPPPATTAGAGTVPWDLGRAWELHLLAGIRGQGKGQALPGCLHGAGGRPGRLAAFPNDPESSAAKALSRDTSSQGSCSWPGAGMLPEQGCSHEGCCRAPCQHRCALRPSCSGCPSPCKRGSRGLQDGVTGTSGARPPWFPFLPSSPCALAPGWAGQGLPRSELKIDREQVGAGRLAPRSRCCGCGKDTAAAWTRGARGKHDAHAGAPARRARGWQSSSRTWQRPQHLTEPNRGEICLPWAGEEPRCRHGHGRQGHAGTGSEGAVHTRAGSARWSTPLPWLPASQGSAGSRPSGWSVQLFREAPREGEGGEHVSPAAQFPPTGERQQPSPACAHLQDRGSCPGQWGSGLPNPSSARVQQ